MEMLKLRPANKLVPISHNSLVWKCVGGWVPLVPFFDQRETHDFFFFFQAGKKNSTLKKHLWELIRSIGRPEMVSTVILCFAVFFCVRVFGLCQPKCVHVQGHTDGVTMVQYGKM